MVSEKSFGLWECNEEFCHSRHDFQYRKSHVTSVKRDQTSYHGMWEFARKRNERLREHVHFSLMKDSGEILMSRQAAELWLERSPASPTISCGVSFEGVGVGRKRAFGVSSGIKIEKEEVSIDMDALEPNTFYLFTYEEDKYVARRTAEGLIEIFEVIE
jgi:hypothetical protein